MDYKKEYEAMVQRARELHEAGNFLTKKQMEIVCPELTESEDERIRKGLIEVVSDIAGGWPFEKHRITKKEAVAYLEKQKEQKPTDLPAGFYFIDKNGNKYYSKEFRFNNGTFTTTMKVKEEQKPDSLTKHVYSKEDKKFIQDCANILVANDYSPSAERLLSMFEQKPVEYLDKDKVYAIMTKLTNLSYSQLIPINSDEFKKLHEITSEVRDLLDYPIEQKPDTRTADDLQLLGFIYDLLISLEWREDYAMSRDECLRRLKDYRPHKPSWSEEDEAIYKEVLHSFESVKFKEHHYATGKFTYAQVLAWLKSLRPSWKPSEEQMEALEIILRYGDKESTHIKNLTSLYEQLKKL